MQTFKTKDGLSLTYLDEGAGEPLLCLAGLTRDGRDFDHFAEALPGGRRIVRLDSRGRGASDRDPNFHNYNVMVEAGDALALLDHLGIEKATIIGSSRGGVLAMVIAATAPQRLSGVVLNDVGPVLDQAGLVKIMSYLGLPPKAKTLAEAADGLEAAFGAAFPNTGRAFWESWAERSFVVREDGLDLPYDPKLRDATLAQIEAADPNGPGLWPLFAALGPVPTLALRAENSDLLTDETLAEMKAKKPDLMTVVVKDRGHIPRLDEPDAIASIQEFLESLK